MDFKYEWLNNGQYCYLSDNDTQKFLKLFPNATIDDMNLTIILSADDLNEIKFNLLIPTYLTIDGIIYEVEADTDRINNPKVDIKKVLPMTLELSEMEKIKKSEGTVNNTKIAINEDKNQKELMSGFKKVNEDKMILMNKNKSILTFTLIVYDKPKYVHDLLPMFEVSDIQYTNQFIEDTSDGTISDMVDDIEFTDETLCKFLQYRGPYECREYIKEILKICHINNILDVIRYTNFTSLTDTFWIKQIDSSLTWNDVSLYDSDFDSKIASIVFSGNDDGDNDKESENIVNTYSKDRTPELSTDGTFAKCWVRINHDDQTNITLKKAGGISGTEPYSEYYAQQVLDALDIPHIKYELYSDDKACLYTTCKMFTSENIGYLPVSNIQNLNGCYKDIFKYMDDLGLKQRFFDMLVADTIIMNEDRHAGNFGFLVDNNTRKIIDYAPLFDHNLSLMWGDPKPTIDSLKHRGHKISGSPNNSFIDFISSDMISGDMRRKLKNMKGFKLKKHPKYNLSDKKLEAINELINYQIDSLLLLR